jgi:hypothetical protein
MESASQRLVPSTMGYHTRMPGGASSPVTRATVVTLLVLLVAYAAIGALLAWVLTPSDYEIEYLVLGTLAVKGEIGLYQDELTGQWVPLPFFVYGLTQLAGPSLLGARLLSLLIGALVLVLVWSLARRWAGPVGGAAAGALLVTQGLVTGYLVMVDYSGLAALIHLLGIFILFATAWRGRTYAAMAVFSVLFLVKPNYWPTVALVFVYLAWRAERWRTRLVLFVIAVAIPIVFFASSPTHLKLLAYVPIARNWVAPLGYHAWFSLIEDARSLSASEYFEATWGLTWAERVTQLARSVLFLVKRYATWLALFALLSALTLSRRRDGARASCWQAPGCRFTLALFWAVVMAQFVVLGPWSKQAIGYVGAIAPLFAVVLGVLVADALALPTASVRLATAAALGLVLLASPWLHRHHNLPRRISLADAAIPEAGRVAARLRSIIPEHERRVFLLADPLLIHLAGRHAYLRQSHQHKWMFTTMQDAARYRRSGVWGPAEVEEWLGTDAQYAVLESDVLDFYAGRPLFRPVLARMDQLLAERFTLVERVAMADGTSVAVYRRRV